MNQKNILSLGLLGLAATASFTAFAGDNALMYEHQTYGYSPAVGSTFTLNLHSVSLLDSTGAMSATLAGAVNQELSREKAAKEKAQDIWLGKTRDTTYTYSWEQPHPVANDGEMYRFFWSSEGHASQMWTKKNTDPAPAMWGLEYHGKLWGRESAPLSYALGYGVINYHLRSNYLNPAPSTNTYSGSGYDYVSTSFPLDVSATFNPLDSVAVYGDFAIGPINIIRKQPRYSHFEGGAVWTLTNKIRLKASFKQVRDYMSDDPGSKSSYKLDYKANIFSLGAGWYF